MLKNNNHVTIHGWMINELNLSSNKLICYAVIYGFSQHGENEFRGDISYISSWVGCSDDTTKRIITELIETGLIVRRYEMRGQKKTAFYSVTINNSESGKMQPSESGKMQPSESGILHQPKVAKCHLRTINNNIYPNNNNKELDLFEEIRLHYPGQKRGLMTEFENYVKKNKNWKEDLPALKTGLINQINFRNSKIKNGGFVPEWPMFQTWINQRRWEIEIEVKVRHDDCVSNPKKMIITDPKEKAYIERLFLEAQERRSKNEN